MRRYCEFDQTISGSTLTLDDVVDLVKDPALPLTAASTGNGGVGEEV